MRTSAIGSKSLTLSARGSVGFAAGRLHAVGHKPSFTPHSEFLPWRSHEWLFPATNLSPGLAGPGHYRSVAPRAQAWPRRAVDRKVSGAESGPVFDLTRPGAELQNLDWHARKPTFICPDPLCFGDAVQHDDSKQRRQARQLHRDRQGLRARGALAASRLRRPGAQGWVSGGGGHGRRHALREAVFHCQVRNPEGEELTRAQCE